MRRHVVVICETIKVDRLPNKAAAAAAAAKKCANSDSQFVFFFAILFAFLLVVLTECFEPYADLTQLQTHL